MMSHMTLRSVLAIAGAAIAYLGLNVGFGGIETLGWQGGAAPFLTIDDPAVFAVRDNHVRFLGGVWIGAGLIFLAGAAAFPRLNAALLALVMAVFVGGLSRFSAADPSVLTSAGVLPSLALELVGFPLLALWIWTAGRVEREVRRKGLPHSH